MTTRLPLAWFGKLTSKANGGTIASTIWAEATLFADEIVHHRRTRSVSTPVRWTVLVRSLVDAEFFSDGRWASQYLIRFGCGDDAKVFRRLPRFNVDEISRFAQRVTRSRRRVGIDDERAVVAATRNSNASVHIFGASLGKSANLR